MLGFGALALAQPSPPADPAAAPAAAPAASQEAEADRLRAEALARYGERDFAAAAVLLERAFAVEPRPEFLFTRAQALRLLGDCDKARPVYEQYLATNPEDAPREAARLALAKCDDVRPQPVISAPVSSARPASGAAPGVSLRPPIAATPAPAEPGSGLFRDRTQAILSATAVASLAGAAGFLWAATASDDDARGAGSSEDHARASSAAESRRSWAALLAVLGTGLGSAAGVRALWLSERSAGVLGRF